MTSSTVGEMGTTKETASDSDQTPVGDDTDINIQSSEVNRQDEDDHNLSVDTHEEESVTPEQLVLSSSQKSGAKSLHKGDSIKNVVVELATYRLNESELQEKVDHLREENEKLEHQLIDKQEETNRTREDHKKKIASLESQRIVKEDEVKVAKSQLAVVEKKNEDEKQKLRDSIKTLEYHGKALKSTVSKLQDDRKTKEFERMESIISLREKLYRRENEQFKKLCDTQAKLVQAKTENALLLVHLKHLHMERPLTAHENALLLAHKEISLTESSSNASSGIESMDELSESDLLYEDRRQVSHTELLEALDTLITGKIKSSNEPFGKYPISV